MRILSVADLHGAQYRMNLVLEGIRKYEPDLVVIAGDITNFGPPQLATTLLDQIHHTTTLVVTGNCDPDGTDKAIQNSNAELIERKTVTIHGHRFIGLPSGSGLFQSKIPLDNDEDSDIHPDKIDSKSILISHVPPYGLQDRVYLGIHGGNKELRRLVDEKKPLLVLCGHIHENPGVTKHGTTTIVNSSIGKRGSGALITITNDKTHVQMLDD